jgi:hypothetical protein
MWQRDFQAVYKLLSGDWPNDLQPVVNSLRGFFKIYLKFKKKLIVTECFN